MHPPTRTCARHALQRALVKLWKLIHDSNEDRAGHLAGVPLPEVDAELLPLQQEVRAREGLRVGASAPNSAEASGESHLRPPSPALMHPPAPPAPTPGGRRAVAPQRAPPRGAVAGGGRDARRAGEGAPRAAGG
jgi:hypothetical protein